MFSKAFFLRVVKSCYIVVAQEVSGTIMYINNPKDEKLLKILTSEKEIKLVINIFSYPQNLHTKKIR